MIANLFVRFKELVATVVTHAPPAITIALGTALFYNFSNAVSIANEIADDIAGAEFESLAKAREKFYNSGILTAPVYTFLFMASALYNGTKYGFKQLYEAFHNPTTVSSSDNGDHATEDSTSNLTGGVNDQPDLA
jgi:hypothetical protein